jgi:fucose permease
MTYLRAFLIVGLPVMGLIYALLGVLKLPLAERLKLDEERVGRLVAGFGMMVGPTILACGFLTDALGRKAVFLGGSAAVALALLLLARGNTFRAVLVAVLLLGAGWSGTINVANVLQQLSAGTTHRTEWINFYDCIFGFGAFVTPFVVGLFLKRLGYGRGVSVLFGVSLVPLVMGVFAPMGGGGAMVVTHGLSELFSSRLFWVAGFAFLFYVPLESSVAGWATTLVVKQGPGGERAAAVALSGFWLAFMGSRLVVALVGLHGRELGFIFALSLACVAIAAVLCTLRSRVPMAAAVVACGAVCGPIFPTLIAVFLKPVPLDLMGRAVGFFFAFASTGWTLVPWLIGREARRTGDLQKGFRVAVASALVFAVLAGLLQA